MQESNKILLLIMNTRRLNQILCSVLHTGTCLTVSKGRRIYPGARCFTGRESDLTLFDCQQKMTSALFLFLLIHRNYRNNFPCWDTNRRHFKGNKRAINTCFTARINCFPINLQLDLPLLHYVLLPTSGKPLTSLGKQSEQQKREQCLKDILQLVNIPNRVGNKTQ